MSTCLGIYLGDNIIQYAKLIQEDKTKRISLAAYGTKNVVGDKEQEIANIISQTGSAEDLLCLNINKAEKTQTQVLKQLGKADIQSVLNLEVADYATGKGINEKTLDYRYIFMNSRTSNDSYTADITMVDKSELNKYMSDGKYKNLAGLYPQEYILDDLVRNESNYLIANIDEKTQLISVIGGKVSDVIDIEINLKEMLSSIAQQEGSYTKACDICRSINVLSDDNISPDIERIVEPTIQDILTRIKTKLDELKTKYERIYLNGLINLFINIDMLFEQFFGITTEKLRPHFIKNDETGLNVAEIIESNNAIALAYEGLVKENVEVNFISQNSSKFAFGSMFNSNKKEEIKVPKKHKIKAVSMPTIGKEKIESALLFANLAAGATLVGYLGFSGIYDGQMTKLKNELTSKITEIQQETALIKSDITYIDNNTKKYTTYNKFVDDTITKIREGKIGKYTTYNVANFMQKIAKYIPTNVILESISSDDNKSVVIVAKSTSYAELGYFISQLKLQGILENIKTGKVEAGAYVTVTIGGDLP